MKTKSNAKAFFVQRLVAFIIDILLVSSVVSVITIPFVNEKDTKKYTKSATELVEKFSNNEISNEEFIEENKELSYNMARSTGIVSLVTIIMNILYFVVYQLYNKGQTVGKRLMKIKIKSDDGELFMNQMIFRAFIANFILVDLISFVFMVFASKDMYFYITGIFQGIQYLIVIISIFMVLTRKDGCSIHDKLMHTKVVRI